MPITWPSALPDMPTQEGYTESAPDCTIRTPMDSGPPKLRRRSTAGPRKFSARLVMTTTQLTAASPNGFKAFYETDTTHGSAEWEWNDPTAPSSTITVRFASVPQYRSLGGSLWEVTFDVEVMP